MGRMLDALRRTEQAPEEGKGTPPAPAAGSEPAAAEEIPFIEVGPRRSMEASPSVLACTPPALRNAPAPPGAPLPAPHSVHFRPVAGRTAARSRLAVELVAYHAPDQPAARQYGEVLDAVLDAAGGDRPAALLFTSARPHSGTTTALLNVALSAARRQRRRVVVVDANLRQPAVADRLGLPAAPGLREVLAGTVALDEALQATEQANLFALTAGLRDAAGVRFAAETMRSLLRQLRQRSALVFVDGPTWDGRPDVLALGSACDAVFLVTPEADAETSQTDALMQSIAGQGARLAGCVLVAGPTPFR